MNDILDKFENLDSDASKAQIEKTAEDLKRRQYMPTLLLNVKDFFYFTKDKMLKEYNRVMNLSSDSEEIKNVIGLNNTQEIKEKHLNILLNQYNLLCKLREGKAEAWDTVNELYEDD